MLHVTCAIIEDKGKILICQRATTMKMPLKWEFPGGKIEAGESPADCLKREIWEELGLRVTVWEALSPVEYQYPEFAICLYPFICQLAGGSLRLAEHAQARWATIAELPDYDWAEADVPIVEQLKTDTR